MEEQSSVATTATEAPSASNAAQPLISSAGFESGSETQTQDTNPAPAQAEPITRPEYVPEKFWNKDTGEADWERLAKSYTELESHLGKTRGVQIPDANTPDEEREKFYRSLGKPEAADKYDFNLPEDVQADENFLGWFKDQAFKANLSNEAANELVKGYVAQQVESWNAQYQASKDALAKEFGQNTDAKLKEAYGTLIKFSGDKQTADRVAAVLGNDVGFIKTLLNIKNLISEDSVSEPTTNGFDAVSSIEKRISEIMFNKDSGDYKALYNPNDPRHTSVFKELQDLQSKKFALKGGV